MSAAAVNVAHGAARGRWLARVLRPTLLFVAGYVVNANLHELAHALTAVWLGIPATLFHIHVDTDTTHASPLAAALVHAGGAVFSLAFGIVCWFAHRGLRGTWAELPLFYLAAFGIALALGNVATIALVGDFGALAAALSLPHAARTSIAVVGGVLLCSFAYDLGRELREFAPADLGAARATVVVVLLPAILGTLVLLAAYQPLSRPDAIARLGEASVWIVAALGAVVGSARPARSSLSLDVRVADWVLVLAALAAMRVLAIGLPLRPAVAPLPPASAVAPPPGNSNGAAAPSKSASPAPSSSKPSSPAPSLSKPPSPAAPPPRPPSPAAPQR